MLIEAGDGAEAFARVKLFERHGYDAAWCPGPPQALGSRCPLVAGRGCPLTDWADVVVNSLGIEHPAGREVLESMRRSRPDLPVVLEARRDALDAWPELVKGHRVIEAPTRPAALLDTVEAMVNP